MQLTTSLKAWGTPTFESTLKSELEQIAAASLPLQRALARSSYTDGGNRKVIILNVREEAGLIRAKTGIFYAGITPGCSCADDPTPMSEITEYCEVQIDIDKRTAQATVTLLQD